MVGTLFGLPLSQRVDLNGNPEDGWLLYIYTALTSTPATTYSDTALTTTLPFPLEADSYGMIPDFWVADGTYRARATNSDGSATFFDKDNILAIGPSSGTGGGGGSGVSSDQVFATGDIIWLATTGVRTGFVKLTAGSIGSATSGATQRANADTSNLYAYCWNNLSDAICPVSGGRGASPTADFTANKTLTLLNMPASSCPAGFSTGTWTPTLTFGGATTGITYTTQIGKYIKLGDTITAWGTIVLSSAGSLNGTTTITGLPVAAVTAAGYVQSGTVGFAQNGGGTPGAGFSIAISVASAATVLDVWVPEGSGGDDYLVAAQGTTLDFSATGAISFEITYKTSATDIGTPGTWYQKL